MLPQITGIQIKPRLASPASLLGVRIVLKGIGYVLEIIYSKYVPSVPNFPLSRDNIRDIVTRMSFRQKYERLKELANKTKSGDSLSDDEIREIELLFSEEIDYNRIEAIKQGQYKAEILDFLIKLYMEKVYLLSRGTIEEYYPSNVIGREKTERALSACELLSSKEDVEHISPIFQLNGEEVPEFELILKIYLTRKLKNY